jgi:hypothetical protein
MYIISFDCGIKNFAYSCIYFDNYNGLIINPINDFFKNNKYTIIDINNVNILNIKCESHITKETKKNTKKNAKKNTSCINLHNHIITLLMDIINKLNPDENIKILIEYQMNINHKANIVYNIIITFFETYYKIYNKKNYDIITIQPAYKNNIAQDIDKENKIRIKYISQYAYNKKIVEMYFLSLNTKYNFLNNHLFKKMDDISDSFVQILSYLLYYKFK